MPHSAFIDREDESRLDAVVIPDTYDHRLTDPDLHQAIERSATIIPSERAYLGGIIQAVHMEVTSDSSVDKNSVSALMKETHPDQRTSGEKIATPVALNKGNTLVRLTA